MKKICSVFLILVLLSPNISFANGVIGPENPNKNISRAEMATVSVRLLNLEYLKDNYNKGGNFKDVKGWALPYINIVSEKGIMMGNSKSKFNPNGELTYVEVLTVLMRILGYEDGIDFKKYPEDYYSKALEIGLGDLYIPHDQIITRKVASNTIDKALELTIKNKDIKLSDSLYRPNTVSSQKKDNIAEKITIDNIQFNTTIAGAFSGELKGAKDFTNFKVELLSKSGQVYKTTTLGKSGIFSIKNFDIDIIAKLGGYKYRVYDNTGELILEGNLSD